MDFLQKKLLILRNANIGYMQFSTSGIFVVTSLESTVAQVESVPLSANTISTMSQLEAFLVLITAENMDAEVITRIDVEVAAALAENLSFALNCELMSEVNMEAEIIKATAEGFESAVGAESTIEAVLGETEPLAFCGELSLPQVNITATVELARRAKIEDYFGRTIQSMFGEPIQDYYFIIKI